MGKRGPKPGFKKAREAAASAASAPSAPAAKKPRAAAKRAPAPAAPPALPAAAPAASEPVLSAADRENPNKLSGQALRDLAHQRGMARSVLAEMPDEKIRMELRYITHNQYADTADAVA